MSECLGLSCYLSLMGTDIRILLVVVVALFAPLGAARAQRADSIATGYSPTQCPSCAEWNAPTAPVHLFGNVYYVGTRGLGAILLTSDSGHILLDAGLPESAAPIMANVRALGFRVEDIRVIVNSHAHYDHAGGIAAVQRASGARVAATLSSALVLRRGMAGADDPQHDIALPFPAVTGTDVRVLADGDTVRAGPMAIVAHLTAGHTPGGTSWSWRSCEGTTCLDFVYADSQTPISADGFLFTRNTTYPNALADFARGFAVLEQLPCDVLLTPHPAASQLWERLEKRDHGEKDALRDPQACRRYAANARAQLARRVASETGK
jgi:metallo-beta-lactamase class B